MKYTLGFLIVAALMVTGCSDTPAEPASEGGWTDNPDRPPMRRAPVATDIGGDVHTGYILVPYPKIITAVPKRQDVGEEPDPAQSDR